MQFLIRELGEEGYAGVEIRATPIRTEIIIRATRTQSVLGEQGRRIRELTSVVQKRYLNAFAFWLMTSPALRKSPRGCFITTAIPVIHS